MPDSDLHWSKGMKLTPAEYFKLGELSVALPRAVELASSSNGDLGWLEELGATPEEAADMVDVLGEVDAEDQALADWGAGDYEAELAALEAEAAEMLGREGPRMDDYSNGYGRVAELVNESFGDRVSSALHQQGQDLSIKRLAREIGREAARRGDIYEMAAVYAEVGTEGHRIELANAPGYDTREIELARYTDGRYAYLCGAADAYGRCAAQFHAADCSHVAESAAARGATPEDSEGWRSALQRHAATPFADSQGRVFRDQSGQAMTAAGHVEALSGQRQGESPFLGDRRTRRELTAPQAVRVLGDPSADAESPEAYGAEFTRGTAATARALAAQAGLSTAADALRQRQAWTAEHDRRVADRAVRGGGRLHPDYSGDTSRERAERMRQREPVQLSNAAQPGEDLLGALPTYTCGQL